MNTPSEGFEQEPGFVTAMKAFFFFNRRYVMVFYSVLGFAVAFAIFASLVSIGMVLFSLISGGGPSEEFEFILLVLIFFSLGFQVLMAFVTIASNLWQMVFQRDEEQDEFPETLKRMQLIKAYFDRMTTAFFRYCMVMFTVLAPTIIITLVLVVPLFTMVYLATLVITFDQTPAGLIQNIFVWDTILVGLSIFLMNYNYYLRLNDLKN